MDASQSSTCEKMAEEYHELKVANVLNSACEQAYLNWGQHKSGRGDSQLLYGQIM